MAHFRFRRRGGSGGVYTLPPPPFQPTAHELWPRFVLRGAARRQIKTVWPKCSAENVLTPEWRDNQRRRAIFNTLARIHIHPFSAALAGLLSAQPPTPRSPPHPTRFSTLFIRFIAPMFRLQFRPVFFPFSSSFCRVFCLPYWAFSTFAWLSSLFCPAWFWLFGVAPWLKSAESNNLLSNSRWDHVFNLKILQLVRTMFIFTQPPKKKKTKKEEKEWVGVWNVGFCWLFQCEPSEFNSKCRGFYSPNRRNQRWICLWSPPLPINPGVCPAFCAFLLTLHMENNLYGCLVTFTTSFKLLKRVVETLAYSKVME